MLPAPYPVALSTEAGNPFGVRGLPVRVPGTVSPFGGAT
jgi:hypothetical protein